MHRKIYYVDSGFIFREIEILHGDLSQNWNPTMALTVAYEKESNRCSLEQTTRNWSVRDANTIERDRL